MDSSDAASSSVQVREGSGVIRLDDTTRLMHVAAVLPVTRPEKNVFTPLESRVYYIAGGHLALKHFNERNNTIIPDLSERLEGCDIQMTMEYRDTQYSRIVGARQVTEILQKWPQNSLQNPFPAALVGAGRSEVSETISTLSGVFQLPQLSPHSSAASLDDKIRFPYFSRTTPSNAADGKAAVDYLHHLQVSHLGVIYILDTLGIAYHEVIQSESSKVGMTIVSAPYLSDAAGANNTRQALRRLKSSGVRYIFAAIEPATWKQFIRIAIEEKIIGQPEFVWLFHSGMVGLVPEELDKDQEYDIARAIHGSGVLLKDFPDNLKVDEDLVALETDTKLQQEFVSKWVDPEIFDGFDFRYPGPNYPQYINYDSIMTLGLAACAIEDHDLFTGDDLYQSILRTEFHGASDYVSFDNATGSRKSVPFQIDNILMIDKGNNTLGFEQVPAAQIGLEGVTTIKRFVYFDNTTRKPLTLPPLQEENLNLVPRGLQAAGLTLCALSMFVSIGWSLWTWQYRKSDVVKASQPFFLIQLCLGTLLMASSIIPMSLQEPISQQGLDIACQSIPWLFIIGFSIAFAALFSKSWRINTILRSGSRMRRVKVGVWDAIFPLVILMVINIVLLTVWTTVSPLEWQRIVVANYDEFGRSRESYGQCQTDGSVASKVIISLAAVVNFLGLVFATFQGIMTRKLPTSFNESFYMAVTNASLLESLILSVPILVLTDASPSASFIVKAILITVLCLCILLPLFVPKHLQRNVQAMREEQARRNSSYDSQALSTLLPSSRVSGIDFSNEFSQNELGTADQEENPRRGSRIIRHEDYYVQRQAAETSREFLARRRSRQDSQESP